MNILRVLRLRGAISTVDGFRGFVKDTRFLLQGLELIMAGDLII
jgi:hypothetical protein